MKIKFLDEEYEIRFSYDTDIDYDGARYTYACLVYARDNIPLAIGWSICSKKDRFDKERGRKIALARLFEDWNSLNEHPNKKQRTTFWRWYLNYPLYRCGNYVLNLDDDE